MAATTLTHPCDRATQRRATAFAVVAMLLASMTAVAIAPMLMPDSYSAVEHSVSESGAQGVDGAWLARLGFLLLGLAVLALGSIAADRWGTWGRVSHGLYGISMFGVAAFAHMPWEEVPYDTSEDLLHSVAAFGVGLAFTAGVAIVMLRRDRGLRLARAFDWSAILAAVVIPLVMFNLTGVAGVVQRTLFGIGYVWYGSEAIRSGRSSADGVKQARSIPHSNAHLQAQNQGATTWTP